MLHLHRAARADVLAAALAELLGDPVADPFAPEVVAVPTRGMERWLTQTMSAVLGASADRADGICANVAFPTPHRLVTEAVAVASGVDPQTDPWLPERAVWPLLDVVDENLGEAWLSALTTYLGGAGEAPDAVRRDRRLSIARHLAGLFDQYAMHRPAMIAAWAQGRDADGSNEILRAGAAWEAELWRRLRARIDTPGPAERRDLACTRLITDPGVIELPERLALFGLTRLPAGQLQVLRALAAGREIHLFLLHPSAALWDAIAAAGPQVVPADLRRRLDASGDLVRNRLLASWGRDARETQLVLVHSASPGDSDRDHPLASEPDDTLLRRLQFDIRADRAAPGAPLGDAADQRVTLAAEDRSVVVHSCHGRVRQVEVLRDAIMHALAEDPTLEPRDVIVMCPDVETYAPLIQATFGAAESDPEAGRSTDLRVRLADRSLTQTNPVLGVISALTELIGRRLTASQVLDLADRGPVRRRFGFDDDDLTRLQDWIAQSGIRWGLDAAHRAPYRLAAVADGTWQKGLDRLLLGVTMTEDGARLFEDVLPLDDVDSRSIELAGRFTELINRLTRALDALAEPRPLGDWARAVADAADALTLTGGRERWQRGELQRILDEMVGEATGTAAQGPELTSEEARAHLAARLAGRPTRSNFRTGHLTVCTLMPMRSVPHRIVCLLGLDDLAFPRRARRDGDDLLLDDPHVGERDPRSEDRQLLLDALMAATDRLIITYTGNDERTNVKRPPAVPVGELLDAIDATARCPEDGPPASGRILVRHPLQPFDPSNFIPGTLDGPCSWSFDDVALQGARALTGPRTDPAPFLDEQLMPLRTEVIDLDDLVKFVQHPVRAFLRRRLDVSLRSFDDEIDDGLPIELDNLERYQLGDRLLAARLAGADNRIAVRAEKGRGMLPPGTLGDRQVARVLPIVDAISEEAAKLAPLSAAADDPVDVRVELAGGHQLLGTVTGVTGDLLLSAMYARLGARHRLAAWVRFLALTATEPERPFAAATLGRASGEDDVRVAELEPLPGDPAQRRTAAVSVLERLVDLYMRGMREPLPIYCETSAAWAEAARAGQDPRSAAVAQWHADYGYDREDGEPEHQLVLGGRPTLGELLAEPARDDERGENWAEDEPSRLGRYARRLWDDLAEHERRWSR